MAPVSGAFGWLLAMLGQHHGFPAPVGGAGQLAAALARRAKSAGAEIRTSTPATGIVVRGGRAVAVETAGGDRIRARRAVVADVSAPALFAKLLPTDAVPARILADLDRFTWDTPVVKLNWALAEPIPWRAPALSQAGTVHLGADSTGLVRWSTDLETGTLESPFQLFGPDDHHRPHPLPRRHGIGVVLHPPPPRCRRRRRSRRRRRTGRGRGRSARPGIPRPHPAPHRPTAAAASRAAPATTSSAPPSKFGHRRRRPRARPWVRGTRNQGRSHEVRVAEVGLRSWLETAPASRSAPMTSRRAGVVRACPARRRVHPPRNPLSPEHCLGWAPARGLSVVTAPRDTAAMLPFHRPGGTRAGCGLERSSRSVSRVLRRPPRRRGGARRSRA